MTGQSHPRHPAVEFHTFLDTIEAAVPTGLAVYLVVDSCANHKTILNRNWAGQTPPFHLD